MATKANKAKAVLGKGEVGGWVMWLGVEAGDLSA